MLTHEELELLLAWAEGTPEAEVKRTLGLNGNQLGWRRRELYRKLEAKTPAQAVAQAYHLGVLAPALRAQVRLNPPAAA